MIANFGSKNKFGSNRKLKSNKFFPEIILYKKGHKNLVDSNRTYWTNNFESKQFCMKKIS